MRALSLVVAHRGFFLAFGAIPLLMALTTALETRQYLPAWRRRIFAGRKLFGHAIEMHRSKILVQSVFAFAGKVKALNARSAASTSPSPASPSACPRDLEIGLLTFFTVWC